MKKRIRKCIASVLISLLVASSGFGSIGTLWVNADGGESYVVTIDAVGEYTISQSGSWFVVNHDVENRCFTVTADAYSESTDRTGTVTVELTGQPDGESKSVTIEVIQYSKDVDVDVDGFEDEKEWN